MIKTYAATLFLACCVLLSGCASWRCCKAPSANPTQATHSALALQPWKIHGSMSVHDAHASMMGSFRWTEQANNYRLTLSGPLGINHFLIYGNPHHVTLQSAQTGKITDNNLERLMQTQLGWSLPLHDASYWVRGLPAPNVTYYAHYDQQHHIIDLWQAGWHIHLSRYRLTNGFDLPYRITLSQNTLTAKVAIKRWE